MKRALVLVLVAAAACATSRSRGTRAVQWHQADEPLPSSAVLGELRERAAYNDARYAEGRAESLPAAQASQASAMRSRAAELYLAFVEKYPGTGWDLKVRYHAARLLARADRNDAAARLAEQVAADPHVNPKSRAMAWLLAANALVDAHELEPLRIASARQRGARPLNPRAPPGAWNRFVEATDAYLDAVGRLPSEPPGRIVTSAQLAFVAAQVQFATDHVDEARRRLSKILETWPGEAEVFESAAPLYVETFLVRGDRRGAVAAAERMSDIAAAQARSAGDAKDREKYEKALAAARDTGADLRFEEARALLDAGHAADAGRAFEALAAFPGADVPSALNAAAIAWDRAGERDEAAAIRSRILEQYPKSWVAPNAALQLAAHLAQKGEHAAAGDMYRQHAERWPDDPSHCTALRNGAVEFDLAKRVRDAADEYRAFGSEARCAEEFPDASALALYRAGKLYLALRRREDARDAFRAATAVAGVTRAEAKRRVAEARTIAERLGAAAGRRTPRR